MKEQDSRFVRLFEVRPRKGDLRRLEVVLAAVRLIAKSGVAAMTLDAVGKALGIGRSHVAYYFKSTEEIVEAAIQLVIATGQDITIETVRRAKTPVEGLLLHVEGTFHWFEKYPEHASVMLMLYYFSSFDAHYRAINTRIRKVGRERILGLLEPVRKFRKLAPAARERLAVEIQNTLTGNLVAHFSATPGLSLEEERIRTQEQVRKLLEPITA